MLCHDTSNSPLEYQGKEASASLSWEYIKFITIHKNKRWRVAVYSKKEPVVKGGLYCLNRSI